MRLGEFLKEQCADSSPWNCSTMPADWCVLLGHPDFAWRWRNITDPGLCDAVPLSAGGLVNLWSEGIGDALPVVDALEPGDIGVIAAHGIEAGAIWTGESWALRATRTVHWYRGDARVIRTWRP